MMIRSRYPVIWMVTEAGLVYSRFRCLVKWKWNKLSALEYICDYNICILVSAITNAGQSMYAMHMMDFLIWSIGKYLSIYPTH